MKNVIEMLDSDHGLEEKVLEKLELRKGGEQARNLERCALKAEKLQHGKLKYLYTDLSPCGKLNAEKTSI